MIRARGFTLLELVLVLGTLTVLALLAVGSYRLYLIRAQAAQALVDVDQITTVVRVENRLDNPDLEVGATAGAAPPKLQGTIPDRAFQGRSGITFTMIKAPAGTFVSYPDKTTYALVATGTSQSTLDIAALRWGLSRDPGDIHGSTRRASRFRSSRSRSPLRRSRRRIRVAAARAADRPEGEAPEAAARRPTILRYAMPTRGRRRARTSAGAGNPTARR